jgi:hypothetical protein
MTSTATALELPAFAAKDLISIALLSVPEIEAIFETTPRRP